MLTRRLTWFVWPPNSARRPDSISRKKSTRLHAERLEDRFMMSADDPLATGAPDVDLLPPNVALSTDSAVARLTNADAQAAATTHDAAQRFQPEAEFEAWLVEAAVAQWGHLFGQSTYHYGLNWYTPVHFLAVDHATTGLAAPDGANGFAGDVSGTNIQVAGVDEADLVETDGEYLYILSGQDLMIVTAGVGDELQVMSRIRLDERPVGMYLSGDRLALVSSGADWSTNDIRIMPLLTDVVRFDLRQTTTVTVLDISDRAAPTLVQKTEMDGQLITSRTVNGQLRLVLTNEIQLPMPIARPIQDANRTIQQPQPLEQIAVGGAMLADIAYFSDYWGTPAVYETQEEYLARLRDEILDAMRPQVRSLALDGSVLSETPLLEATDVYRPESLLDRSMTTIVTIDLAANESGPSSTATIFSAAPAHVYATADGVYLFSQAGPRSVDGVWSWSDVPVTKVWKFTLDSQSGTIDLAAQGEFEGALLNQFAADEHDGYLRVVAHSDRWRAVGQKLHVLQQVREELEVIGTVEGIAPSEELYSVRFIEDRAFFVTFPAVTAPVRQVQMIDPLFAVDLSDPHNPELLGELHIPGFSDYLQPIDENYLVAIGRGADEVTGLMQELQVSIFDVSDLSAPRLAHRYSFGGGFSTASAATGNRWIRGDGDHHAVSYFPSEGIFAIPIFSEQPEWWDPNGSSTLFDVGQGGLQVFRIDVDAGFVPLGIIEHDALVERSVQIGDRLYAISSGTVTVHELTNPDVRLGELNIAADSSAEPVALTMYEAPIETVSSRSSNAESQRPAPCADWMPFASGRVQYKPVVRTAAFATITHSQPLDDELANAIAIDAASAVESPAASTVDPLTAISAVDDVENSDEPSRQLFGRRGAFRPLETRLGR